MILLGKSRYRAILIFIVHFSSTWSGRYLTTDLNFYLINISFFYWTFQSKINNRRVDELTGYIIVKEKENRFDPTKFDVKLTEEYKVITGMIRNLDNSNDVCYEYCLIPHQVTQPAMYFALRICDPKTITAISELSGVI